MKCLGTGEAQWYNAELRAGWSGAQVLTGALNFSLHHRVQTGSETQLASYPASTRGSFPRVKRPGREHDHSPPSSAEVKEGVELHLHIPNTPSCHGAQLEIQEKF
jgi:hypothetical protein